MGELLKPGRDADRRAEVTDFVERRIKADEFLSRFSERWRRDRVAGIQVDGVLASIRGLCETYAKSLPAGAGYRVSEEQFRLEVQRVVSAASARRLGETSGQ